MFCVVVVVVQTSFQEVSFISAKGGDLELLCVGFVVLENVLGLFMEILIVMALLVGC